MSDVLHQAFFPVTLPFTVVLLGLALYWGLVALGVFDLTGESDAGSMLDADADFESPAGSAHGPLGALLQFLNLGEVPFLVVFSILMLAMWVFGMIANFFFNDGSIGLGLLYLLPNVVVSLCVTRFATLPFRKIFRLLNHEATREKSLVGQTCVIRTREATHEYGQAEVASEGAPLLLQVRTREGESLPQGATALIIGQEEPSGPYLVIHVTNDNL